ncbi:uncharacterized protein LOC119688321 [Teleopsis dalmanni]|uniref:uncharacterized protein LOC119688321 n=1 Tax=Teleopsis dalmanni TaxID=139649 RepID=UPI0018CFEBA8|nr:uncharacterized protein LOC119688321 [Teleopsis dalmanni]
MENESDESDEELLTGLSFRTSENKSNLLEEALRLNAMLIEELENFRNRFASLLAQVRQRLKINAKLIKTINKKSNNGDATLNLGGNIFFKDLSGQGGRSDNQSFKQCKLPNRLKKWNLKQDEMLIKLVKKNTTNNVTDWTKVTSYFRFKPKGDVIARYTTILKPNINHRPFSPEEDLQIIALVKKYGERFKTMPREMFPLNRTILQVRNRYLNTLKHRHTNTTWTYEDDVKLEKFIKEHGTSSWLQCAELLGNHTRTSCRTRYLTMEKFYAKNPNSTVKDLPRHKVLKSDNLIRTDIYQTQVKLVETGEADKLKYQSQSQSLRTKKKLEGSIRYSKEEKEKHLLETLQSLELEMQERFKFGHDYSVFNACCTMWPISILAKNIVASTLKVPTPTLIDHLLLTKIPLRLRETVAEEMQISNKSLDCLPPNYSSTIGYRALCLLGDVSTANTNEKNQNQKIDQSGAVKLFKERLMSTFFSVAVTCALNPTKLNVKPLCLKNEDDPYQTYKERVVYCNRYYIIPTDVEEAHKQNNEITSNSRVTSNKEYCSSLAVDCEAESTSTEEPLLKSRISMKNDISSDDITNPSQTANASLIYIPISPNTGGVSERLEMPSCSLEQQQQPGTSANKSLKRKRDFVIPKDVDEAHKQNNEITSNSRVTSNKEYCSSLAVDCEAESTSTEEPLLKSRISMKNDISSDDITNPSQTANASLIYIPISPNTGGVSERLEMPSCSLEQQQQPGTNANKSLKRKRDFVIPKDVDEAHKMYTEVSDQSAGSVFTVPSSAAETPAIMYTEVSDQSAGSVFAVPSSAAETSAIMYTEVSDQSAGSVFTVPSSAAETPAIMYTEVSDQSAGSVFTVPSSAAETPAIMYTEVSNQSTGSVFAVPSSAAETPAIMYTEVSNQSAGSVFTVPSSAAETPAIMYTEVSDQSAGSVFTVPSSAAETSAIMYTEVSNQSTGSVFAVPSSAAETPAIMYTEVSDQSTGSGVACSSSAIRKSPTCGTLLDLSSESEGESESECECESPFVSSVIVKSLSNSLEDDSDANSTTTVDVEDADDESIDTINSQLVRHGLLDGCLFDSLKLFRDAGMRVMNFTEFLAYAPLPTHVPPTSPDYMKTIKSNHLHQYQIRKMITADIAPDVRVITVECATGIINTAAYSDDATMMAVGVGKTIYVLSEMGIARKKVRRTIRVESCKRSTLEGHEGTVRNLHFARFNNFLVSSGDDITIRIWALPQKLCMRILTGHTNLIRKIFFSSHYTYVASCSSDDTVRIWSGRKKELHILQYDENQLYDMDLHPNNNYVACAASNGFVVVWSIITGKKVRLLKGHTEAALRVKFSACGRYIVSSGRDALTLIWDIQKTVLVAVLKLHTNYIISIHITEDSEQLILVSCDKVLSFWNLKTLIRDYVDEKYSIFAENLTLEEKVKCWERWQNKYLTHRTDMKATRLLCTTVSIGNMFFAACAP